MIIDIENKSTGPRSPEGKQRSSQNSLKHGLFAKSFLLSGESEEEYDRVLYRYKREFNPKGVLEEDMVNYLAQTEWRRRRIPILESDSIEKSIESGDPERKFMNTYSIYEQRFNRVIQSTLKTLQDLQTKRKREFGVNFRIAVILYNYYKIKDIPWNPADDGFVFSTDLLHRRFDLAMRLQASNANCGHWATDDEIDAFVAKDIM